MSKMCSDPLKIGTRASLLARTQAAYVRDRLQLLGYDSELVFISTPGDRSSAPIESIGVGVFTSSIRQELLAGKIDIAVHSYKDLPTAQVDNLLIAAIPEREDPRDVLISHGELGLQELPDHASVGTSALRRIFQLTALRSSLEIRPLRGNLDSRLRKVSTGELDAVVVARAGLLRLGLTNTETEIFTVEQIIPAPAQGALAIECRETDVDLVEILALLDHLPTRMTVTAERAVLTKLEAGCTAPIGAFAKIVESVDSVGGTRLELALRAVIGSADGAKIVRLSTQGAPEEASVIGGELAERFLTDYGRDFW